MKKRLLLGFLFFVFFIPVVLFFFQYFTRASYLKANLVIDTRKISSPLNPSWKALAQGGEEKGVRMLGNVISQITELSTRYIRIDHIYDFYDVVSLDNEGNSVYNWEQLDQTVCDILTTGAKPFFSLGYMPSVLSKDGTVISPPKDWNKWQELVQKTVERYSGRGTILCGGAVGHALVNTYYEVWNEPDLESFGSWSIYGGEKDYKLLYYYAAKGAEQAQSVNQFSIGGPATTRAYKNWFQQFLKYTSQNNLRVDFLSWHHYTPNPDDFTKASQEIDSWITEGSFGAYSKLPRIISEWGYDSNVNSVADTETGAAYTIAAVRNLLDQKVDLAFSFEVKDGPAKSWGILTHEGVKKPRFNALKFLNMLEGYRLVLSGEGSYVRAIATYSPGKITTVVTNYDRDSKNFELVPISFLNVDPGIYHLNITHLTGEQSIVENLQADNENKVTYSLPMTPNSVIALELVKK